VASTGEWVGEYVGAFVIMTGDREGDAKDDEEGDAEGRLVRTLTPDGEGALVTNESSLNAQ